MQPFQFLVGIWETVLALPRWQGFVLVVGASLLVAKVVQVGGDVLVRRVTTRIPGRSTTSSSGPSTRRCT
ncbi:hypothetical protein VB779_16285 [Haloarculaceae archaeon H-GB11]|nr:hypothetical protein [Haloarculaceae archaeon H-GB11]